MSSSVFVAQPRLVLADLMPKSLTRELALVIGGVILTAAAAQLVVPLPFTPVPITGQTFAVLLLGFAYGPTRGAVTLGTYVMIGAAGVPVYASAAGGVEVAFGATGGYLMAFPLAAALVGAMARRGWDRGVLGTAAAFVLGSVLIYAIGVTWLAAVTTMSWGQAFLAGAAPFLVGDAIKAILAAVALPLAWRAVGRQDPPGSGAEPQTAR